MSLEPHVSSPSGARSILDAATQLFAVDGFEGVSISQIASQAGVSKSNIFHHFQSKEALYLAVMQEASAIHADYAEALYDRQTSSESKIQSLIEFEVLNLIENEHRTRLMMRETATRSHSCVSSLTEDVFDRNFRAVTKLFHQGVASGEFRRGTNVAAAALVIHGAAKMYFQCRGAFGRFPEARELEDPKRFARRIGRIVLAGVVDDKKNRT